MEIFGFILYSLVILWIGFLGGQWWFGDRLYPYRIKCDGTCWEDVPFRIATNERIYAHRAYSKHLEAQHAA